MALFNRWHIHSTDGITIGAQFSYVIACVLKQEVLYTFSTKRNAVIPGNLVGRYKFSWVCGRQKLPPSEVSVARENRRGDIQPMCPCCSELNSIFGVLRIRFARCPFSTHFHRIGAPPPIPKHPHQYCTCMGYVMFIFLQDLLILETNDPHQLFKA